MVIATNNCQSLTLFGLQNLYTVTSQESLGSAGNSVYIKYCISMSGDPYEIIYN